MVGHIAPEAWVGGPIAFLRDGDRVTIDAEKKVVSADLSDAEWERCKAGWTAPPIRAKGGVLAKYARTVRSASEGAITT